MNKENVVVKMPNTEIFLVETYDKEQLMRDLEKIETVLELSNDLMDGCLDNSNEKVIEFFNFLDSVHDYSPFENTIDFDLYNIF